MGSHKEWRPVQTYDLDHYFTEVKREPIRFMVVRFSCPVLWGSSLQVNTQEDTENFTRSWGQRQPSHLPLYKSPSSPRQRGSLSLPSSRHSRQTVPLVYCLLVHFIWGRGDKSVEVLGKGFSTQWFILPTEYLDGNHQIISCLEKLKKLQAFFNVS